MNKGLRPDPRTMPVSKEYEDGFERTFGQADRKPGGRWRWSKTLNKLVELGSDEDIQDREDNDVKDRASNHIYSDRHHWGNKTSDGVDIGSKEKRRQYLKATGAAEFDDYKPDYGERVKRSQERREDKKWREALEKAVYSHWKP